METTQAPDANAIIEGWACQGEGVPREQVESALRFQIQSIRALAEGQPVTAAQMAARMGLPVEHVQASFDQMGKMGCELNASDDLVGNVLTLNPTPHHFRVKGHDLYAWCALDTLFLPAYVGAVAHVESTCPVTGHTIRLMIGPDGVRSFNPSSTMVSIVDPSKSACSTPGPESELCSQMLFFSSREAAETWQVDHPDTVIHTVEEAYRVARVSIDLMKAVEPEAT